jgi:N-methylhydantoinase A
VDRHRSPPGRGDGDPDLPCRHAGRVRRHCGAATGPESDISLAYDCRNGEVRIGSRPIHFLDFGEVNTPVYDHYALALVTSIRGPAVFHERHSSCAFGPDCVITVDDSFNLVAQLG